MSGEETSSHTRMTRHHNNHHRRKGEEIHKRSIDIIEQEPNDIDRKTDNKDIVYQDICDILASTISHGSRAITTCFWGIDDIRPSVLDYLDSSSQWKSETDDIKQNLWLNIKDPQHAHIKCLQQTNIKHTMVGDNHHHHHITNNADMFDISNTESTSSDRTDHLD